MPRNYSVKLTEHACTCTATLWDRILVSETWTLPKISRNFDPYFPLSVPSPPLPGVGEVLNASTYDTNRGNRKTWKLGTCNSTHAMPFCTLKGKRSSSNID